MSRPLVIGHAAGAGEAPANTLAGVRVCLEAAGAIEIDLRLCGDGVPVLLHDETLDRTTNLSGPVREAKLAELRGADAGRSEHVPTLDEVLDLVAGRITVMCELKVSAGRPGDATELLTTTVAAIRGHDAAGWTALHSFDHGLMQTAHTVAPEIPTAAIAPPLAPAELGALCARAEAAEIGAISLDHRAVDARAACRAHELGLRLWAWTADAPDDWLRLTDAGVDGIITNQPTALRTWGEGNSGG